MLHVSSFFSSLKYWNIDFLVWIWSEAFKMGTGGLITTVFQELSHHRWLISHSSLFCNPLHLWLFNLKFLFSLKWNFLAEEGFCDMQCLGTYHIIIWVVLYQAFPLEHSGKDSKTALYVLSKFWYWNMNAELHLFVFQFEVL